MKVDIYSAKEFEKTVFKELNTENIQLVFHDHLLNVEAASKISEVDYVSVFTNDDVSEKVLQALASKGLKGIAIRAAGYDNVDLVAAKKLGIKVANVPEYSPYSVAEHSIALMMALNRNLVKADRQVKKYNFLLDGLQGFDMHGKTVGIIGLGRIGAVAAKILKGFGCKLLAFDPQPQEDYVKEFGVKYCTLKELCQNSDIISIYAPLTNQTKYLINSSAIADMKEGVMLINTGRGGIVNTKDVLSGLDSGKIGYFGMDVYEHEKGLFFYDHSFAGRRDELLESLFVRKNVLITGHQAFLTSNALQDIIGTTLHNIHSWNKKTSSGNEL